MFDGSMLLFSKILPNNKRGRRISLRCSQKAVTYLFDNHLHKEQHTALEINIL